MFVQVLKKVMEAAGGDLAHKSVSECNTPHWPIAETMAVERRRRRQIRAMPVMNLYLVVSKIGNSTALFLL